MAFKFEAPTVFVVEFVFFVRKHYESIPDPGFVRPSAQFRVALLSWYAYCAFSTGAVLIYLAVELRTKFIGEGMKRGVQNPIWPIAVIVGAIIIYWVSSRLFVC